MSDPLFCASSGVQNFRARMVSAMLGKSLSATFEKEWKAIHGGKAWSGEQDAQKLIENITRVSRRDPTSEKFYKVYFKPIECWPAALAGTALMSLLPLDVATLSKRLSVPLDAYKQWTLATEKLHSALSYATSNSKCRRAFEDYADTMSPILSSLGFSTTAISEVMNQTDFAPNAKSDADNEALQKLKGEGNEAFQKQDFAGAISKYSAALVLPNLTDDSRAILYSNSAACYLELNEWVQARRNAKMALRLKPVWFKPHLWYFRALNALSQFEKVLDYAGVFPYGFPLEWRERAGDELRIAIFHFMLGGDKPTDPLPTIDEEEVYKSLETLSALNGKEAPKRAEEKFGTYAEMEKRSIEMVEDAASGYKQGKYSATVAVTMAAQAVLMARAVELDLPKVIVDLSDQATRHLSGAGGMDGESKENRIIRIVARLEDRKLAAIGLLRDANLTWPKEWWFHEQMATMFASMNQRQLALESLEKAIECAPKEDPDLLAQAGSLAWQLHLQKHGIGKAKPSAKSRAQQRGSKTAAASGRSPDTLALDWILDALNHLPVHERVPQQIFERYIKFIQNAPCDHPNIADAHLELAAFYLVEEQEDLARQTFESACKMQTQLGAKVHSSQIQTALRVTFQRLDKERKGGL